MLVHGWLNSQKYDIVSQMALRWAWFGEDKPIDVTTDLTRLTLDTIALYVNLAVMEAVSKQTIQDAK